MKDKIELVKGNRIKQFIKNHCVDKDSLTHRLDKITHGLQEIRGEIEIMYQLTGATAPN
jgi:predicted TIM-barrel fold metal-dependent hydrolase